MTNATRVLVFGGRGYGEPAPGKSTCQVTAERRHVWQALDRVSATFGALVVITGAGPGAGRAAEAWVLVERARGRRCAHEGFPPRPGPGLPFWAAAKARSRAMVTAGARLALVFPGGEGTRLDAALAQAAGIDRVDERASAPEASLLG